MIVKRYTDKVGLFNVFSFGLSSLTELRNNGRDTAEHHVPANSNTPTPPLGARASSPPPPVCHSPHWFPSRPHRPWERGPPAHTRWCVTPPIGSHHARTAPGSAGLRPTPAGVSLPPLVPITPTPPLGARASGPHPPVSPHWFPSRPRRPWERGPPAHTRRCPPIGSHHAHTAPGSAGFRPAPAGVSLPPR
jgi:hypothetical protein